MMISAISVLLLGASRVSAHSWIWCTDYEVQNPTQEPQGPVPDGEQDPARITFNSDLCNGWPPNFDSAFFNPLENNNFGVDFGYEDRPNVNGNELCLQRPNTYSDDLPMAEYTQGEVITLVYPAKNHVAAATTNQFIPDNGVFVYLSDSTTVDPNTNFPTFDSFKGNGQEALEDFNLVHQTNTIDYRGYQNCPNFDNGNDRATCTMSFQLPEDIPLGRQFFAWVWEFNTGEYYSTCWEAFIQPADANGRVDPPSTEGATTTTEATTTEAAPTIAGVECSIDGLASCTKGLTPPRGTCWVTDENDPENAFVCDCAEGFEIPSNPQTCALEAGVRIRVLLNVEFDQISDQAVFERALELDLSEVLEIEIDRLSITFSEGEDVGEEGLVIAIISVAGNDNGQMTSAQFFDTLQTTLSRTDANGDAIHGFGTMSNALSVSCLNCPGTADAEDGSSSSAVVPSVVVVAASLAASLMH